MSYYNDLSELGIILKKTTGICKVKCPKCSLTRKNKKVKYISKYVKRGLKIFAYGLVISLASYIVFKEGFVYFGILHFIGVE